VWNEKTVAVDLQGLKHVVLGMTVINMCCKQQLLRSTSRLRPYGTGVRFLAALLSQNGGGTQLAATCSQTKSVPDTTAIVALTPMRSHDSQK
jgi:hypothetical protein